MGYVLFFFFIGVPVVEISVFIAVGDRIGLWPTLAAILVTAIIGASLLRAQGLAVLFRAQEHLNRGQLPMTEIFDGLCLLVAGAFLLTPGFVTDSVGFLLFVPPLRRSLGKIIGALLVSKGAIHVHGESNARHNFSDDGTIIDGDFEEIDPKNPDDRTTNDGDDIVRRID